MLTAVTYALVAATFVGALLAARYANERHLAFLILALWLRFALSALPEVTTTPLVAGQSLNALGSLAAILFGGLIIARKTFLFRPLLPLYLFTAVVIVSAIANAQMSGLASGGMRLAYLVVIASAMINALGRNGASRTVRFLIPPFLLPLGLLWASVALGVDQHTLRDTQLAPWQEASDLGMSYVGTYDHESTIGLILLSLLLLLPFWKTRARLVVFGLFAAAFGGLLFTNYRTAIVAAVPLAVALFLYHYFAAFSARAKAAGVLLLPAVIAVIAVVVVGRDDVLMRFEDLARLGEMDFSRSPAQMTEADREIMSGRYVIWTNYIYAWLDGGLVQRLVGFGPESWRDLFNTYAHNTFVSFLYEFGLIGTAAFLGFWIGLVRTCGSAPEIPTRMTLLSGAVGFLLLNFATMPMWKIEGMIFLGLLDGLAIFYAMQTARRARPSPFSVHDGPRAATASLGRAEA